MRSLVIMMLLVIPAWAVAQDGAEDGRYAVVTGTVDTGEKAQAVVVLVDSITGRTWMLSEGYNWHPLPFAPPSSYSGIPEDSFYPLGRARP